MNTNTSLHQPTFEPKPWSLPLVVALPSHVLREWHRRSAEIGTRWKYGIGGQSGFLGQREAVFTAHNVPAGVQSENDPKHKAQSIYQRVLHQDLLETVLLHGQDRVAELLRVGAEILRSGVKFDPRAQSFKLGVPLGAESKSINLQTSTFESLAYSFRYLSLRTDLWSSTFPLRTLRKVTAVASTERITKAATSFGEGEIRRVYEAAIVLASFPLAVQRRFLEIAPSTPCVPYAEAVSFELETRVKNAEFECWKQRKLIEPGGSRHASVQIGRLSDLPISEQCFLHRLVRHRLDAFRRIGRDNFAQVLSFSEKLQGTRLVPLQESALDPVQQLTTLQCSRGKITLPDQIVTSSAKYDHGGWYEALLLSNSFAVPDLTLPTGAKRGDGADCQYEDLSSVTRNRVRINVLCRFAMLPTLLDPSDIRSLKLSLL